MKVNDLIKRLEEARDRHGNIDVFVGEASSVIRSMIDVNSGMLYQVRDDEPSIVIQAYVRLG